MLKLTLPIPPSVNAAFINRKSGSGFGRIKSPSYQEWLSNADVCYQLQRLGKKHKKIAGTYRVQIIVPPTTRADIDNLIKPTLDWLVSRELVPDDRHCLGISIERGSNADDMQVTAYAEG